MGSSLGRRARGGKGRGRRIRGDGCHGGTSFSALSPTLSREAGEGDSPSICLCRCLRGLLGLRPVLLLELGGGVSLRRSGPIWGGGGRGVVPPHAARSFRPPS